MTVSGALTALAARDLAPDPAIAIGGVIGVALLVGVAAVVATLLLVIKRSLVAACPVGLSFSPAEPVEYPDLDLESLDRYSSDLERLGFVALADYTISAERGTVQPGFARLFGNSELQCHAEVNQLFPASQSVPMRVVLATRFADGWSAATTDRRADAAVWLLRRPRSCWRSIPDAPVEALLESHRGLVQLIANETRARPDPSVTAECWYDAERRNAETVRETLSGRNIVVMVWEYFSYRGRTEWLGSLKSARSNVRNDYN
jgi:hypothetical protein